MDLLAFLDQTVTVLAHSPWLYAVVVAVCLVDGFFPPVPSESVVVAAATVAAATGAPHVVPLVAVAAVGALAGDSIAFAVGRRVGTSRWRWMRARRVAGALDWARRGLERRGAALIFTARYIPVGRVAVNMTAGATGFPTGRFLAFASAAGATWALYSTGFGLLVGRWLHDQPVLAVVLAVALALAVGLIVDAVLRRVQKRRADA